MRISSSSLCHIASSRYIEHVKVPCSHSFYAVLKGGTNIAATIHVSSIYADEARYLSGPEPISLQPCCLYHDILHFWQACSDHELSPLRRVLDESPDHLFRPSF
jgi:hypothetical protein